jgi:two-component system cell cycle sensor histidine kinase/response regulator CckA
LLVEDEKLVRGLVHSVLQRCGYTVLEANDGQEALRVSEQYRGPIQLLVTDVVMPHMDGPTLVKRLATTRPAMKVLYLSGHQDAADFLTGVADAGACFLQKPFTLAVLERKVRALLDQ